MNQEHVKPKAVSVITKVDVRVGHLAVRARKNDLIVRMNGEYKDLRTIPAGTTLCLREAWRGLDGEDRVYVHGYGWFKTDKRNGLTLESAFAIKSRKGTFDGLFTPDRCYENLKPSERLRTLIPLIGGVRLDGLNDTERAIVTALRNKRLREAFVEIRETTGYAESTLRDKILGRRDRIGLLQKLERTLCDTQTIVDSTDVVG